jgi:DNA-binding response OmpR family regulator
MRVLLVEDDAPLGGSLQEALRRAGMEAIWVRRAEDGKRFLATESFNLALLDIVLPGESGLDLLTWIRAHGHELPVLMLTARDSVTDRVRGLDGGADDYLPKPFSVEELLSRIRAVTRRTGRHRAAIWRIGELVIDTARRRVAMADREVVLSSREFDVLCTLASEPGRVFTRSLIERSASHERPGASNSIDVHVHNLRRKLGNGVIGTVRGVGYVLELVG